MALRHVIMVHADYENMQIGFWCDTCLLPSVVKVPLYVTSLEGVTACDPLMVCAQCDREGDDDDLPEDLVCG